ncbi:MAG: MaoC/PaaZ C-terminal domain-containing protein [Bordetella sp.]|nr:MaoC/PaaZ C-terminal domain-containing protein [Bordetella sp.]
MLDYRATRDFDSGEVRQRYGVAQSLLYALAIGAGADPLDRDELRFVYEVGQETFPSMACVLAQPGFWMRDRKELGIDALRLVHGEQRVRFHAPLPPAGEVVGRTRVTHVVDKGPDKGAVLYLEKALHDAATGRHLATVQPVVFCRGDGGFSAAGLGSDEAPAPLQPTPTTAPDRVLSMPVRADAALLYRLCGDMNPLHADPDTARRAGFERPILHGLATYGFACRGLLQLFCGPNPARLRAMDARMSAPTYPSDTLQLECWAPAAGAAGVAFRVTVPARNTVVLSHGRAEILFTD